ncbi:MAG: hypothetical protein N2038_09870 [Geminicoccaceae bacterium]|nr:hypothetical protein [Geminicoccaceae bacterium]
MRRSFALSLALVSGAGLLTAAPAEAGGGRSGLVGLVNRLLPASPATLEIRADGALSRCGFSAQGGASARGSCGNSASSQLSSTTRTSPAGSTTSFSQSFNAGARTAAAASGAGSSANGNGRATAGSLYLRLTVQ